MATASLGRLTLDLVARISGYTEPLSKAERETRRSTKAISESFDLASLAVKGFGVVMGGLSVAGVIAYSEKVITAGNDIQKFSKLANASTAQLQYYAKGAETAGISLESFADKMKDMQDRIGDFQQTGGGPLADFFTNIAPRVGVTIQQFQKLSGPEALQLFYNSLEKAGASTNDMKFYMEQIISDSSLLIPLLEKNGQGFKFWGDAAQKAGAIMSDDMVKSLAEAKSNLQLLDLQWQGLQATLVNQVVPVVELVIENWDKIEAGAIALSAVIGTRLALAFVIAGGQAAASLIQYTRYQIALARMAGETITLTTVTRGLGGAMLSLVGGPLGLIALGVQVAIAGGTYYAMTRKTQDATEAFDMQGKSISDLIGHYNGLSRAKQQAFAYDATKDLQNDVEAYSKAREAFYDSAVNIAYGSADSEQAVKAIDDLVAKFKAGSISAEDFANGMVKLGLYTDQQISTTVKFAEKVDLAKSKMDAQKNVVDALKIATDSVNKSQKDQTKTVNDSASAWQNLTEKQRKYIEQVNTDLLRDKYISDLVGRGFTPEKANAFADAQANTNEGNAYKQALPQAVIDATLKSFNHKNFEFSSNDRNKIAGAVSFVTAHSLENLAKAKGLPANLLTGLIAQESGGKNLTSPTGATGEFQTTAIFRKQHAATLKAGNYSHTAYAQAASDELLAAYKEFGNWVDALMAYNGGIAGTKAFKAGRISNQVTAKGGSQLINGQLYLSPAKAREMQKYPNQVLKYQAGANGSTKIDQSMGMPSTEDLLKWKNDAIQAAKVIQDAQDAFEKQLASPLKKMDLENAETVQKLQETYADNPVKLKEMLDKNDVLYKAARNKFILDGKAEYDQYFNFEKDRITQITESYERQKEYLKTDTNLKDPERKQISDALEREKQKEISAVRREQDAQVQAAIEAYLTETDVVVLRYQREREEILANGELLDENRQKLLQANQMGVDSVLLKNSQKIDDMSYQSLDYVYRKQQPNQAAWTDLENQYYGQQGALNKAYSEQRGGIFSAVDDENERNSQLLAAHEQYLQAKAALDDEFAQRGKDLVQSQHDAQMNIWQDLLTRTGTIFSSMAEMIKNTAGESSAAYKVMFLTNQSISMAQAMINTEVAATKAMAEGGYFMGIPMASAIRGLGYASVGLIAAQTIAGMAHNGIDNIPREGTWLLDGGERVLNPQQNKDLTNYLNQRQSAGNGVNVVINNYGNDKVQTSTGPDGSLLVEIEKMVDGAVDRGIQRNMKQGYPLDRAFQRK
ncbi:transglycosylase SLT domain-containing protein [Acinetobacter sp.]|uniref:transglycosylase SLT domain-containing protein n=1 Tax=Acinetobacter sp. TaxID=472 RepID=UPI0025837C71|nr:transglycosylase SLT domain-containing protein [Acinetobacter sp.]